MEKYRIDRACETIYEYDPCANAYVFLCSFFEIGANKRNKDNTVIQKVEDWKYEELLKDSCFAD